MGESDTLLFRNLPPELSDNEREDFLKYLGATKVRLINRHHAARRKRKHNAFARFRSHDVAKKILCDLHQKEICGHRIAVEFADKECCEFTVQDDKNKTDCKENDSEESDAYAQFLNQLNGWIKGLNLDLPPPCHLRYRYPPPSPEVLHNIVSMVASVPKFYTQVLHLMNRMNLPSSFEPTFPVQNTDTFSSFVSYIQSKYATQDTSSEQESELETEDECKGAKVTTLRKRKSELKKPSSKRPKILKPALPDRPSKKLAVEIKDVFESINKDLVQKKIEMKVPDKIDIQKQEESEECNTSGFGVMYPSGKSEKVVEEEHKEDEINTEKCITAEELASNRIPEKDFPNLPVFKNYYPGAPSCRLYIKNLSKRVTRDDLARIYGRYFVKGIDAQGVMFDIQLMQEGRMKGQAFITLQNVKQAELALKETNGYILKDKPMVVQFARSVVKK